MRYELIVTLDGEETARMQTSNPTVAFNTIRGWEETFTDFDFVEKLTNIFITDKDTKTTHTVVIDGNERYCDGEEVGRRWDEYMSFWF